MKNLLKKFQEFSNDAINEIVYFDENKLINLLTKSFSFSDNFIIPHKVKIRKKRDDFFKTIINYCEFNEYNEAKGLIINKIKLAHCTETLFDNIKESLRITELSKQPSSIQCWAQITRIENEIEQIKKTLTEYISSIETKNNTFNVSQRYKIEYNGISVDPDFLIEHLISSLALSLMLLSHENKWFESGELTFPSRPNMIEQDIISAGDITSLAIAWQKLSDISNRCMLFNGDISLVKGKYLSDKDKQRGIKEIYCYHPIYSDFEKYDFIANKRLIDRSSQNFFEMVLESNLKKAIVDDIEEITSIDDNRYLSENEIHALQELSKLYCHDIVSDKNEYKGLRIKEWVRGYSCFMYLSSQKKHNKTYRKLELISLLVKGGLDHIKAEKFLKLTTFGLNSRDFYDKPLLLLDNGEYYLFHTVFSGFSISTTVYSVFSQLEVEIKTKGKMFEESIIKRLKQKNIKTKSFKFKRDLDEYEYDAVFILDNRVFVVECKNRSLSSWNSIRSARFNKFLSDTSKQVKRLVDGLIKYPEVFSEHFNEKISDFEVIPLIMNCLPFSYAGKFEGVYISDSSSFGKFLLSGTVSYNEYESVSSKKSVQKFVHHLWSGNYPSSDDLIRHLENPIQLEVYENNIEEVHSLLPSSQDTYFVVSDLKADMNEGFNIKFGSN
ncbi:hypothetical protein C0W80_15830 [Photobacterium leiognathi subsp. mandapamensis]|uniref:nuclease-related domain-containing protein n=1 Tax=Photobacterium leiognathi TaxID=553611 RepID=UPI000D16DE26|nr:nuclease-related domain-containing protein [Photobacterium leiognathi]PSU98023.1 hypothetical protein C0W80_15830 [Photobacterium leiognathi subsp. mandapamensis]